MTLAVALVVGALVALLFEQLVRRPPFTGMRPVVAIAVPLLIGTLCALAVWCLLFKLIGFGGDGALDLWVAALAGIVGGLSAIDGAESLAKHRAH